MKCANERTQQTSNKHLASPKKSLNHCNMDFGIAWWCGYHCHQDFVETIQFLVFRFFLVNYLKIHTPNLSVSNCRNELG